MRIKTTLPKNVRFNQMHLSHSMYALNAIYQSRLLLSSAHNVPNVVIVPKSVANKTLPSTSNGVGYPANGIVILKSKRRETKDMGSLQNVLLSEETPSWWKNLSALVLPIAQCPHTVTRR